MEQEPCLGLYDYPPQKRRTAWFGTVSVLFLIAALSLADCRATRRETVATPVERVAVRLKWLHQAQFAGFYCAKELASHGVKKASQAIRYLQRHTLAHIRGSVEARDCCFVLDLKTTWRPRNNRTKNAGSKKTGSPLLSGDLSPYAKAGSRETVVLGLPNKLLSI